MLLKYEERRHGRNMKGPVWLYLSQLGRVWADGRNECVVKGLLRVEYSLLIGHMNGMECGENMMDGRYLAGFMVACMLLMFMNVKINT